MLISYEIPCILWRRRLKFRPALNGSRADNTIDVYWFWVGPGDIKADVVAPTALERLLADSGNTRIGAINRVDRSIDETINRVSEINGRLFVNQVKIVFKIEETKNGEKKQEKFCLGTLISGKACVRVLLAKIF